ncbi:MAG: hypothetical protein QW423_02530 [Candidatus Aenigmatarchaeota archaeon]
MTYEILYSYTEASIIAAKIREDTNSDNFIRVGISFTLNEDYRRTIFKPEQEYCSARVLDCLSDLNELINDSMGEKQNYLIRKAELCYGGSVSSINKNAEKELIYMMREPIRENNNIRLNELKKICDKLKSRYKDVALYKDSGIYLSAAMPYNPLYENPGVSIDLLDIRIPREVLGCRVEFVLPERIYDCKKIEGPFNSLAQYIMFGKMLEDLEKAHQEFLDLVDQSKEVRKLKVVKKISV